MAAILLVDSDEKSLSETSTTLSESGFAVTCVTAPRKALNYLAENRVDAVLTESKFNSMSGTEFIASMMKAFGARTPRVFLFSDQFDEETLTRAANLGVEDFFLKSQPEFVLAIKLKRLFNLNIGSKETKLQPPISEFKIGNYIVEKELARGGMGIVYQARHQHTGQTVALKTMLPSGKSGTQTTRFIREMHILTDLSHPNLVKVFESGQVNNRCYYAMEFLPGQSLGQLIALQGPRSIKETAAVLFCLSNCLAYLHSHKIVHRDLKPSNVLLSKERGPILCDFGLTRRLSESMRLTKDNVLLGTPNYMAPEYILGKEATEQADLFALGIIGLEMLNGEHVMHDNSSFDIMSQLVQSKFLKADQICQRRNLNAPKEFIDALNGLVHNAPEERIKSATRFCELIKPFAGDLTWDSLWQPLSQSQRKGR